MKPPVWTWEVPIHFFLGGVAGLSAVIALVASTTRADTATVWAARAVAAAGAVVSPLLLISDLGRPARFLYMLRVFKPVSAMSVGAWTLTIFSGATFAALALSLVAPAAGLARAAILAFDTIAAATGLVLATYTGVLLGATVIPVWASRHRSLPFEFGISSLGAAASVIELVGGFTPPLHRAALAAAGIKTLLVLADLARSGRDPRAGQLVALAGYLSGPLSLALRIAGFAFLPARAAAAVTAITGSVLQRYGWLAAGRAGHASMRK